MESESAREIWRARVCERERENLENLSKRRRMRDLHQKINTLLFSLTRLKGLFLVAFCRVVSEEHLTVCFVLLVPGTLNTELSSRKSRASFYQTQID